MKVKSNEEIVLEIFNAFAICYYSKNLKAKEMAPFYLCKNILAAIERAEKGK